MKKRILLIILVLIMMFSNIAVFAANSQYQDAANKKTEAEGKLDDVQDAKSKALQEISTLEESIDKVENEIEQLNTKIINLNNSINEKTKQIAEKEKEYKEKEEILKERMVVLYEAGQTSYLEVLLTSKSITDFISKYYIMSEVAEADSEVLNEIETTRKEIEDTRNSLEDEKKEVDEIKKQKTAANNKLILSKNEKQSKINSLSQEEKELQSQIDEYNRTMNRISEMEKKASQQKNQNNKPSSGTGSVPTSGVGVISGTGRFTWPIPGYTNITSYYGYRIHPVYGIYKLHTGIDVGAPKGAKFVAADDGVVILAEYYGGYGNCVVIDHGNGLFTRYAHGTSILVTNGQRVTKGTPVLTVGSTGISTGNHAHFEVSVNGVTVNPLNYL